MVVASSAGEASAGGPRVPTSFEGGLKGAAAFGYVAAFPAFPASDHASLEAGTCRVSTCVHDQDNAAEGPSPAP